MEKINKFNKKNGYNTNTASFSQEFLSLREYTKRGIKEWPINLTFPLIGFREFGLKWREIFRRKKNKHNCNSDYRKDRAVDNIPLFVLPSVNCEHVSRNFNT